MEKLSAKVLILLVFLVPLTGGIAANPELGEPAPDFALRSRDGVNLRLSEFRTQVVVLNFWAPWCGECRSASNALNRIHEEYKAGGLAVLGIAVDGEPEEIAGFVAGNDMGFPVLLDADGSSVSRLYSLGSVPLTVVIDRLGKLRYLHKGYNSDTAADIEAEVVELLAE